MSDHVLAPAAAAASPAAVGPRLLVVDADDRTRASLVGILGIRHRFTVIGNTAHVSEAVGLVRELRPDVVIVDPRLPDVSGGVALIRRIRAIDPAVHILAVGWSPDLENATLTAGAHGFMRKTLKPGDLDDAVERCLGEARRVELPDDAPPPSVPGPSRLL